MKKLIVCILILAFALSFAACAAANQPITDVDALEEQVNADWAKKQNVDEGTKVSSFRYYGTDNGYHIVMFNYGVTMGVVRNYTIAGYTFDNCATHFMAYKNGKFIDLKTAYFFRLVSKEAIAKAAELHNQATTSQEPEPTEPLTPKEAYIRQYGPVDIFREYITVYEYGNAISIIYAVQQDAPASETVRTIAGFEFKFQREGSLCVYKHGVFTDLEEAYNKKLIAKEHIEQVAKTHARFESKTK